jgi:thiamine biosynthesis lipoprotein
MTRGAPTGLLVCLALGSPGCLRAPPPVFEGMEQRTQWVMGSPLTIALPTGLGEGGSKAFREAFAIAHDLDALLSDYRPGSALSRLNARAGKPAAPVEPALLAFLRRAQDDTRRTEGAFDLTVGAITHAAREGRELPARLRREAVGLRVLEISRDGATALRHPVARLDPGGIGKGHALEAMVARLRAQGIRRAFIDFGGSSFYGLGAPAGREGWPVQLRSNSPGRSLGIVLLRDMSLSVSMSRLSPHRSPRVHIVDPRTGRFITEARFAAALSPSATDAEVLSTALIVDPSLQAKLTERYPGSASLLEIPGKPLRVVPAFRAHWVPAEP